MRIAKLSITTVLVICSLLTTASPSMAGGARYYKDRDQKGFRVELHASRNRVISGVFIASGKRTLKCDDGVFVGGFPFEDVRIVNGRFHTVAMDTWGDGGRIRLMIRGAMRGEWIRGKVSLHFENFSAEGHTECWSGKGKANPLVSYAARAGG
jgi:hypothetical protein